MKPKEMTNKERAKLLRSAASAIEHGRHSSAEKKLKALKVIPHWPGELETSAFARVATQAVKEARAGLIPASNSEPETSRYLVVSYDPDEQQWFWDTVVAPINEAETAEEYVLKVRPCVTCADVVSVAELARIIANVHNAEPSWDTTDPLTECQNCGEVRPQSKIKSEIPDYDERVAEDEDEPCGECPDCGALCHEL